jgi:uncharacterized protein (TIGR03083 family)
MPPTSLPAHDAFVGHLQRESRRFREVLALAPADVRVPTCPDWDADDLLWHLGEVQWFWGEIVERRLTGGEQLASLDEARVTRPADRAGLLAHFDRSSERLQRQLRETPPETELWMWADDHSAAYIARRQAHEALVHRIDAELVAGAERADIDCQLAADGVDEALRVMRGFTSEPGFTAEPIGPPVMVADVDRLGVWTVTPLRVQGTDEDGTPWDVERFAVADGPSDGAAAEVAGTAADLDCWLWNRPATGEIQRQGDSRALETVDRVVRGSID